jgi:hypothetical protein
MQTGFTWSASRLFSVLDELRLIRRLFVEVGSSDIADAIDVYQKLAAHDHHILGMRRSSREMGALKSLPSQSRLRFPGYFAIGQRTRTTQQPNASCPLSRQIVDICF